MPSSSKICVQCGKDFEPVYPDYFLENGVVTPTLGCCSIECKRILNRNKFKEKYFKDYLPKRFVDCDLTNYRTNNKNQEDAVFKINEIKPGFDHNVFITGIPGTGKTHLAIAIFKISLKDGRRYVFENATKILMELKSTFGSDSENENDVIKKYSNIDVLIIDDIGAEKITDYVQQSWYQILDNRYNNMIPTIFTSNLTIEGIADSFGDRIASRMASGIIIKIDGDDWRLKK